MSGICSPADSGFNKEDIAIFYLNITPLVYAKHNKDSMLKSGCQNSVFQRQATHELFTATKMPEFVPHAVT
jgi:hypothetical protein